MRVTKGLIIADPWIDYILDGAKDWEMRSSGASHRGWFALIRKGTGAIFGVAKLIDVGTPLSLADMITSFEHHRIPEHMISSGKVAKWNTPWKLADVRRLDRPVLYRHKSGAVTWVELDTEAVDGIARQLGDEGATIGREAGIPSAHTRKVRVGRDETGIVDVSQRGRELDTDIDEDEAITDVAASVKATPLLASARIAQPLASPAMAALQTVTTRVIGEVEITDGNISNNHIYLRSFFDCFPSDAIGGSNKSMRAKRDLTIDWGGAEPAKTDLDGQKKFFRARGWIGAFYRLHRAQAGDRVVVEEIAAYRYRVSVRRRGSHCGEA